MNKQTINNKLKVLQSTLLLAVMAFAGSVVANELQSINYQVLPGDQVELRLSYSEVPPAPQEFTTENPARIAMDFMGVQSALENKSQDIGVGILRSVTAVEAPDRTRVVLNLVELKGYQSRIDGNDLVILLGAGGGQNYSAAASSNSSSSSSSSYGSSNDLGAVDFRRGQDGEARVLIDLNNPNVNIDLRQEGRTVIADFLNADIADQYISRLDVVDFGTPAQIVETSRIGGNVRIAIRGTNDFEYLAYQADDKYAIELKPLTPAEVERRAAERPRFDGKPLSFSFQDISVRSVLQIIADHTGINMVTSDSVEGNITLRLDNVPWDQALDIILRTKGLDKRSNGNVMLIAPADEIAAREKLELQVEKQTEELSPLRTEFVQINYAKASDIADLLKGEENSLLSERGNVSVDERTNTLLVQDTAAKLDELRNMVEILDIPVRQVLIESRIVTADDGFSRELGVRFGVSAAEGDDRRYTTSGSLLGSNVFSREFQVEDFEDEPFDSNGDGINDSFFEALAPIGDRLNVDLPVQDAAGSIGFTLARLGNNVLLDLELSALETENRGEVIANPRVVTANQKEAYIEAGEEIPYLQSTSSGATSITFKKAVLSLVVTPQITPDNRIILDLRVNQDTRGVDTPIGPAINTQELNTQVLVDNGETIVLGGIYQQRTNIDERKVPLLGDLPGVGWMFRTKLRENRKTELLIFVTPKLIDESLGD